MSLKNILNKVRQVRRKILSESTYMKCLRVEKNIETESKHVVIKSWEEGN